ncbi:MAG: divergent polysaccharide deacetylase family protein [Desulfobacterales bacterium]|nr:divergent polysaccharide deacetylase family protein [Desulfobacterales bacterium]
MDRRSFLLKSASLLAGSLFGMNGFSRAFGFEEHESKTFFKARMALIIDDIGYSFSRARQFLELGVPITFSILPRLASSYDLAVEIHDKGHEIMLHQPMEPYNSNLDPGPGALYVGYGSETIGNIVEENISDVPFAVGVNNHMGSRFTECRREINEALTVVKNRGLFFVDSFTSSRSIAYKVARRRHMVTARRNIFLDNHLDESAILSQLHKLRKHARKYGRAVGIGHPFPKTARAIERFLSGRMDHDVSLVHVSKVLCT